MNKISQLPERIKSIPGEFILNQKLTSGPISQVFLCTFNNIKAVIRLDLPCAPMLAFDRMNEITLLNSIQSLQISPKVLYHNASDGILIWEFIPGDEPAFNSGDHKEHYLKLLGQALNLIHSTAVPKNCLDIFSNSMSLYKNLLENSSHQWLCDQALRLYEELLKDGTNQVLSHNDLNHTNLLWDKKFYFLDWEYSGPNHPCFDIASIVKTYQLNQSEIDHFSIGYGGNKELFRIKKLNQWITFIQYLDEIWKISVNRVIEQLTDDAD
jgi:hypothetical protein